MARMTKKEFDLLQKQIEIAKTKPDLKGALSMLGIELRAQGYSSAYGARYSVVGTKKGVPGDFSSVAFFEKDGNWYAIDNKSRSGKMRISAIDVLTELFGMDFKTACAMLSDYAVSSEAAANAAGVAKDGNISEQKKKTDVAAAEPQPSGEAQSSTGDAPEETVFVSEYPTMYKSNHVFAYLTSSRAIPKKIVDRLLSDGLLYESRYITKKGYSMPVCVFPIRDENGQLVGEDSCGTSTKFKWKSLTKGSDGSYAWYFKHGVDEITPDTPIFFCESPIDTMSLCALRGEDGVYASLSGAGKINTLKKMAALLGGKPYLCVDGLDDDAANKVRAAHPELPAIIPVLHDFNDDLVAFTRAQQVSRSQKGTMTEDEQRVYDAYRKTNSDKLKEISERLTEGVQSIFTSDAYTRYLTTMSKFHKYSLRNLVLIFAQNPEATLVAGFSAWRKLGRSVKRGETGIKVIAPITRAKQVTTAVVDDKTHEPILDDNGDQLNGRKDVTVTGYRVVHVFDVSQTTGKELPTASSFVKDIEGNVDDLVNFCNALAAISPAPISFDDIQGGAHGYYSLTEKKIVIKEGLSEAQMVKTMIHEIAHAILHDLDVGEAARVDNRTREVQAESVAYTVCAYYGLDSSDYSFGYIAGWSGGREVKELAASLELIRRTAEKMIDGLNAEFDKLQKQAEREAAAVPATSAAAQPAAPEQSEPSVTYYPIDEKQANALDGKERAAYNIDKQPSPPEPPQGAEQKSSAEPSSEPKDEDDDLNNDFHISI